MALWRHRRRLTLMALGLSGLLSLASWWQATSLSPFEREIVGEWAIPQAEVAPRAGFVTASGPVTNPWMVWDFRRDRSFRVRIVSPDDPSVNIPHIEGRWRVSDGELSLDDLGAWAWIVREARERFGRSFGVPTTGRISARRGAGSGYRIATRWKWTSRSKKRPPGSDFRTSPSRNPRVRTRSATSRRPVKRPIVDVPDRCKTSRNVDRADWRNRSYERRMQSP